MYLKLQYPNKWIETHLITDQTTVRDVIFNILYKKQIPLQFYKAFTIIHTYFDKNSEQKSKLSKDNVKEQLRILQYDMLIEPLVKMNTIREQKFLFYILVQPYDIDLQRLEFTYLQMLYQQCQAEILDNNYPIDDPIKFYKLGAITASYEFGKFKKEKHCQGFFKNNINNIVPQQLIQHAKQPEIEKAIFDAWQALDQDLQINKNELALAYLQTLNNILPQYGSFVIKGTYNKKNDAFYYINQVGIQIRSTQDGKCYFDGKIGAFDQMFQDQRTTIINNLKIGTKKTDHLFQSRQNLNLEEIQNYIQQQTVYQRDYIDDFIDEFIKSQQLNSLTNTQQMSSSNIEESKILDCNAFQIEQNVLNDDEPKSNQAQVDTKSPNLSGSTKLPDAEKQVPMLFQPNTQLVPPKILTEDNNNE